MGSAYNIGRSVRHFSLNKALLDNWDTLDSSNKVALLVEYLTKAWPHLHSTDAVNRPGDVAFVDVITTISSGTLDSNVSSYKFNRNTSGEWVA